MGYLEVLCSRQGVPSVLRNDGEELRRRMRLLCASYLSAYPGCVPVVLDELRAMRALVSVQLDAGVLHSAVTAAAHLRVAPLSGRHGSIDRVGDSVVLCRGGVSGRSYCVSSVLSGGRPTVLNLVRLSASGSWPELRPGVSSLAFSMARQMVSLDMCSSPSPLDSGKLTARVESLCRCSAYSWRERCLCLFGSVRGMDRAWLDAGLGCFSCLRGSLVDVGGVIMLGVLLCLDGLMAELCGSACLPSGVHEFDSPNEVSNGWMRYLSNGTPSVRVSHSSSVPVLSAVSEYLPTHGGLKYRAEPVGEVFAVCGQLLVLCNGLLAHQQRASSALSTTIVPGREDEYQKLVRLVCGIHGGVEVGSLTSCRDALSFSLSSGMVRGSGLCVLLDVLCDSVVLLCCLSPVSACSECGKWLTGLGSGPVPSLMWVLCKQLPLGVWLADAPLPSGSRSLWVSPLLLPCVSSLLQRHPGVPGRAHLIVRRTPLSLPLLRGIPQSLQLTSYCADLADLVWGTYCGGEVLYNDPSKWGARPLSAELPSRVLIRLSATSVLGRGVRAGGSLLWSHPAECCELTVTEVGASSDERLRLEAVLVLLGYVERVVVSLCGVLPQSLRVRLSGSVDSAPCSVLSGAGYESGRERSVSVASLLVLPGDAPNRGDYVVPEYPVRRDRLQRLASSGSIGSSILKEFSRVRSLLDSPYICSGRSEHSKVLDAYVFGVLSAGWESRVVIQYASHASSVRCVYVCLSCRGEHVLSTVLEMGMDRRMWMCSRASVDGAPGSDGLTVLHQGCEDMRDAARAFGHTLRVVASIMNGVLRVGVNASPELPVVGDRVEVSRRWDCLRCCLVANCGWLPSEGGPNTSVLELRLDAGSDLFSQVHSGGGVRAARMEYDRPLSRPPSGMTVVSVVHAALDAYFA